MIVRNLVVFLSILMLLGSANAISISPAKISADRQNNSFEITAINNSEQPVSLNVILEGLEDKQLVFSSKTLNLPGKASDKITVTFYDNVFVKDARICFIEGGPGEESIVAALKVCSIVDVVTTEDGNVAKGEPKITGSAISATITSLLNSLERLKSKAQFAANSCFKVDYVKIDSEIEEIEANISASQEFLDSGNLDEAGVSVENANKQLQEADLLLPVISLSSESNIPSQSNTEEILSLLQELGVEDQEMKDGIISTNENFEHSTTLQVFKFTDKQTERQYFATKTTISIVNKSSEQSQSVYVIERMPDFIGKNDVYGGNEFTIGNLNPFVAEWFVPFVEGRGQYTITYCINKEIGEGQRSEFRNHVISTELLLAGTIPGEANKCTENKDCDDRNICTNDACSNLVCTYSNMPDGSSCGEGMVCRQGSCNAVKDQYELNLADNTGMIVIGVVILLMASLVAVAYLRIFKSSKSKDAIENISTPMTMNEAELRIEIASRLKKWISGDSEIVVESVKKMDMGFSAIATIGKTKVLLTLDKNLELEGVEEIK